MNKKLLAAAFTACAVMLWAGRADAQLLPAEDHIIELGLMSWTPSPQITLTTDALAGRKWSRRSSVAVNFTGRPSISTWCRVTSTVRPA